MPVANAPFLKKSNGNEAGCNEEEEWCSLVEGSAGVRYAPICCLDTGIGDCHTKSKPRDEVATSLQATHRAKNSERFFSR